MTKLDRPGDVLIGVVFGREPAGTANPRLLRTAVCKTCEVKPAGELSDGDLDAVAAGKGGTPQFLGRAATTRPFRPLLGFEFWSRHAVAK